MYHFENKVRMQAILKSITIQAYQYKTLFHSILPTSTKLKTASMTHEICTNVIRVEYGVGGAVVEASPTYFVP